jgi:hypothetical protein
VWSKDTTFNIVMSIAGSHDYKIDVNINGIDTMEKETGAWSIASDSSGKNDTVWMDRMSCRQINFTTQTLDSIDCGIARAAIGITIDNSDHWIVPLNAFVKYLPAGLIPAGFPLPQAAFVKDPS